MSPKTSQILLPLVLLVFGLTLAPAAAAQEQPIDETALADQYKETIPTASGPKITGGDSNGPTTPLPPGVAAVLTQAVGEKDAKRLEEVATSPRFGAPAHAPDEGGLPASSDTPNAVSAAVSALTDESGGSLLPLLLAVVLSTGALFGAAVYRRRQRTV
ncbi:MAG: hypothetical protein WD027_04535 [Gaiellales bacterium]